MANKKGKKGKARRKIPIIPTTLFLLGLKSLYDAYKEGGLHRVGVSLIGYDPNYGFNWKWATSGIFLISAAVSNKVIASTGLRKGLNIPWFTL